ncbi:hypothetical protein WJX74_001595 [Apatococcus lobatus]|uniref:Uncharacterized protein n=1 Tax=Apatococcus lobatus TaxID=904363 RepID=A0AAW1QC08_9CHLO
MFLTKTGLALLLFFTILAAGPAEASLIVFGDSYSDAGTSGHGVHQAIHAALTTVQLDVGTYPLAPYREGRCSNGLVWTEIAAANLGLELESFATANAGSGAVPTQLYIPAPFGGQITEGEFQIPNTLQQAQAYLALKAGVIMPADIVLIFIGTNDYMFSQPPGNYTQPPITQVITAIIQTMDLCYHAGARRFVLVNVPPLWTLPALPGPNPFGPNTTVQDEALSNAWFEQCVPGHNAALAGVAAGYAKL